MDRLAWRLIGPQGAEDPMAFIENFCPFPNRHEGDFKVPTLAQIDAMYQNIGMVKKQWRYGLVSQQIGALGYSPAQFDEHLRSQPAGVRREFWYIVSNDFIRDYADQYEGILNIKGGLPAG